MSAAATAGLDHSEWEVIEPLALRLDNAVRDPMAPQMVPLLSLPLSSPKPHQHPGVPCTQDAFAMRPDGLSARDLPGLPCDVRSFSERKEFKSGHQQTA